MDVGLWTRRLMQMWTLRARVWRLLVRELLLMMCGMK